MEREAADTLHFRLYPEYLRYKEMRARSGFKAESSPEATLRDVATAGELIDAGLQAAGDAALQAQARSWPMRTWCGKRSGWPGSRNWGPVWPAPFRDRDSIGAALVIHNQGKGCGIRFPNHQFRDGVVVVNVLGKAVAAILLGDKGSEEVAFGGVEG